VSPQTQLPCNVLEPKCGGLLFDRHKTPLTRRFVVYYCSAVYSLGFSIQEAHEEVKRFSTILPLLPDTDRIYPEWFYLIVLHEVSGVKVYDARLIAAMSVHGVTRLLTFNADDFARYVNIEVFLPKNMSVRAD
jgi:predicted nucleic acid-binding protein